MIEFARTRIGMTFFEATLPKIADSIAQVAKGLAQLNMIGKELVEELKASREVGIRPLP